MNPDKTRLLRFLAGHELAAARSLGCMSGAPLSANESFQKAMKLRDFAVALTPMNAALTAARLRDDALARSVWIRLKAAYR